MVRESGRSGEGIASIAGLLPRPSDRPAAPPTRTNPWTARDAIRPGGWQPEPDSDGVCTCTILRPFFSSCSLLLLDLLLCLDGARWFKQRFDRALWLCQRACSTRRGLLCSCHAGPALPCWRPAAHTPVGRSGQTMDCYKSSGASGACGHLSAVCCSWPFFQFAWLFGYYYSSISLLTIKSAV